MVLDNSWTIIHDISTGSIYSYICYFAHNRKGFKTPRFHIIATSNQEGIGLQISRTS